MAENEEDYLDGLLKSLSEDENAQSENKDEEEEQIKEQVREAFEKSNEKSTKFENIYDDEDGNLNDDNIEDLLKDVMTVPRHMAASDTEETFITDDTVSELTPEEVAKKAQEADKQTEADDTSKDKQADEAIDKMLDDTPVDEAAGTNLDKNDELMDDMGLSDTEKDRLASMNLDDLIGEMNDNADESSMNELLKENGMQSEDEVAAEDTSADNASLDNVDNGANASSDSTSDDNGTEAANKASVQNKASSADEAQADKAFMKKKHNKKQKKKDKKGIFSVIKDIFFESIEDDLNEANVATGDGELLEKAVDNAITAKTNTVDDGKEQDENEKLIDEVFHGKANLDQPEAPKKGLIAKIKYRYQQFKIRQEKEGKLEEEQEQIENQQKAEAKEAKKAQAEEKKKQAAAKKEEKKKQAKQAKDKKPKKEKKPKKVKVKEPPKPGDILKIKPKSIILFILLIAGIIMLIQVFGYSINYNSKVNAAKDYFINGEYEKAYNSLSGMNLSGNEETIYNQSKVVMLSLIHI